MLVDGVITGNKGIGITDPDAKLHIFDDATKTEIFAGE